MELVEQRLGVSAGPSRGEEMARDLRVDERKAPPPVDEVEQGGELFLRASRSAVVERVDELPICRCQSVEVPSSVEELRVRRRVTGLRSQDEGVERLEG